MTKIVVGSAYKTSKNPDYAKWRNGAFKVQEIINFVLDDFKKNPAFSHLNWDNISITIAPLKGVIKGRCVSQFGKFEITLDVRFRQKATKYQHGYELPYTYRDILATLAHELCHAAQEQANRLSSKWDWHKGHIDIFDNKEYINNNRSFEEYWNLPWEVEARAHEAIGEAIYHLNINEIKEIIGRP